MSRLGSSLSTLGSLGQKASGAMSAVGGAVKKAKATRDAITSTKTFKSLQGTMNSLLKMQASALRQAKKTGALQFLQQENDKEFQREQMEFWQILLQKLDSIEKKLDGMGLGGKGEQKEGLLKKLFNFVMSILGVLNTIALLAEWLPKIWDKLGNLARNIENFVRRKTGLPEKPKPGETKPGETKPKDIKVQEEEARAKAEEARTKAEEARAKAEEAKAKAEEARVKAEEAKAKTEEARKAADDAKTEKEKADAERRVKEAESEQKNRIS